MRKHLSQGHVIYRVLAGLAVVMFVAAAVFFAYRLGQRSGAPQGNYRSTGLKVLVIGVDGAEWAIIEPMMEEGNLPNFSRLVREGTSGRLKSIEPILSPIIWTTIATGKSPEKHGITWFMVKDPEHSRRFPVQSTMRQSKAVWNIVSEQGLTSGTVGWWASYPAERVNGFVVTDYIAYHAFGLSGKEAKSGVGKTYPPELFEEAVSFLRDPLTIPKQDIDRFMNITQEEYDFSANRDFDFGNPLQHFMYALGTTMFYRDLGLELYKKHRPDWMGVYFEQVDSLSHLYMKYTPPRMEGMPEEYYDKYKDVVASYYRFQDEIIGRFLDAVDKNTVVIICSDHGFKTGNKRLTENEVTSVAQAHKWHEIMGVFIIWGPPIREGIKIEGASVMDVTPTALYLMGLPVADDMDGKVLVDAISSSFLDKHPIRRIPSYESGVAAAPAAPEADESGVDEAVMAKLKALGYVGDNLEDTEIRRNRIEAHMKKGNLDAALAEVEQLLAKNPDDLVSRLTRARIVEQMGKADEAETIYREIAALDNADLKPAERMPVAEALKAAAVYDHLQGKTDDAVNAIERSLEILPGDANAEYNLGVILESAERYPEAIEHYQKAIELNPKLALAHNNLGNCYQKTGELEKALLEYDSTAEADPNHIECHYNKAILLKSLGRVEEAKQELEKSVKINPAFDPAILALADIAMESGDKDQALLLYQGLVTADPQNPRYLYMLGRAYALSGDAINAREKIEQARKIDPAGVAASLAADPGLRKVVESGR